MYSHVWRRIIDDVSLYLRLFESTMNVLQRDELLLIYETIISTQTAVAAPSDLMSEWNNTGHMLCYHLVFA